MHTIAPNRRILFCIWDGWASCCVLMLPNKSMNFANGSKQKVQRSFATTQSSSIQSRSLQTTKIDSQSVFVVAIQHNFPLERCLKQTNRQEFILKTFLLLFFSTRMIRLSWVELWMGKMLRVWRMPDNKPIEIETEQQQKRLNTFIAFQIQFNVNLCAEAPLNSISSDSFQASTRRGEKRTALSLTLDFGVISVTV